MGLDRSEVLGKIKAVCSAFLDEHKRSICSIVLTGSLARNESLLKSGSLDADISLVTWKHYNPILCRQLEKHLKRDIKGIKFDVGRSWPITHAKKEKSLFLYDIRNNGLILAGKDIKSIIPLISVEDLYPYECVRLLLNACCHLVFSLCDGEEVMRKEINKAMAWSLDAFLLLQKEFASTRTLRRQIAKTKYPAFFKQINEVEGHPDLNMRYELARAEILQLMDLIRADLKLRQVEDIVEYTRDAYHYSVSFRIYSLLTSRLPKSILGNPVFDVYALVVRVLKETTSLDGSNWRNVCDNSRFQKFKRVWEKLPQPIVRRSI